MLRINPPLILERVVFRLRARISKADIEHGAGRVAVLRAETSRLQAKIMQQIFVDNTVAINVKKIARR